MKNTFKSFFLFKEEQRKTQKNNQIKTIAKLKHKQGYL